MTIKTEFDKTPDSVLEKEALAQQEQPASVDAYVGAREDAAIWKKRALEAEELNRKFIAELNGPTYLGEPAQQAVRMRKGSEAAPESFCTVTYFDTSPYVADNLGIQHAKLAHHCRMLEAKLAQQEQPAQEAVAYELEAVKFANGKKLVYQKPENLASYIKVRTLVYADADPAPTQPAFTQEPPAKTGARIQAIVTSCLGCTHRRYNSGGIYYCEKLGSDLDPRETFHPLCPLQSLSPTQPALSDDEILNCFYASKSDGMGLYMLAVGRAIEAHCRGGNHG